jgi:hypothetical protein
LDAVIAAPEFYLGGISLQNVARRSVCLHQECDLHYWTHAHREVTSDLPEDVTRLDAVNAVNAINAAPEFYIGAISLQNVARRLYDEDVVVVSWRLDAKDMSVHGLMH